MPPLSPAALRPPTPRRDASHGRGSYRRPSVVAPRAALALLWLATIAGCELLDITHEQTAFKQSLSPVVMPQDGIELEVYFVERPTEDPLIGESLWSEVNEINGFDPRTQSRLKEAGIRCGIAGSSPPSSIRALVSAQEFRNASQQTRIQTATLMSGRSAELETAIVNYPFRVTPTGPGGREPTQYDAARCILRVSGERVQEGWVRLEFLPEIHHGNRQVRTVPTDHAWELQESQQIDPLYEQRFEAELNLGEMVIIGATGAGRDTVGRYFFRGGEPRPTSERLVIIRVRGIQRIEPVRAETF
jgi:hypothetical protein